MGKAIRKHLSWTLFGDWKGYERKLRHLRSDLHGSMLWGQEKASRHFVKKVKGHLRNQDIPGWTKLSAERKRDKASGRWEALIDTEQYINNIKFWRKRYTFRIGVPRGVSTKRGIEVARIASIHETWAITGKGPYRPLWSWSYEDFGGGKKFRSYIEKAIENKLRRKGFRVTKRHF